MHANPICILGWAAKIYILRLCDCLFHLRIPGDMDVNYPLNINWSIQYIPSIAYFNVLQNTHYSFTTPGKTNCKAESAFIFPSFS